MQTLAGLLRGVVESEKLHHWAVSTPIESGHANTAWLTVKNLESGSLAPHIVASCNIESERINEWCDVTAIHNTIVQTREPVLIQDRLIPYYMGERTFLYSIGIIHLPNGLPSIVACNPKYIQPAPISPERRSSIEPVALITTLMRSETRKL